MDCGAACPVTAQLSHVDFAVAINATIEVA
jgi:hypothetical protein